MFRIRLFRICSIICGSLVLCHPVMGRGSVHGIVSDVANNAVIKDAQITLQSNNYTTTTDAEGYFSIPSYIVSSDDLNGLNGMISGSGNRLYWSYNSAIQLRVFNISGKTVLRQQGLLNEGSMSMQSLAQGLYLMVVNSPVGHRSYTLLKSGNKLDIGFHGNEDKVQPPSPHSDTLLIVKDGYYDAKIPISIPQTGSYVTKNIDLLKRHYELITYFTQLISKPALDMISSSPAKTQLGEIESAKIMLDSDKDVVYYMNSMAFDTHFDFAKQQLGYPFDHGTFNYYQYNENPRRYFYPVTLNYYKALDIYTFEFFSGDGAGCNRVKWCYDKIRESSYIRDNLYFYSTNDSWANCRDVPTISPNELYQGQNYQALNLEENFGYLRKVDVQELKNTPLQRHDIILTNGIPIDIAVIAGIITTEFQTPLSHINVLSHNRGTPNMALKGGFSNPELDALVNQLIYLKVTSDSFIIRLATLNEATQFWELREPKTPIVLTKDTYNYGLVNLENVTLADVDKIGGKAANFGELIHAFKSRGLNPPVPEANFAIPFYFYQQHFIRFGLDAYVDSMLNDEGFKTNSLARQQGLKRLQDRIKNSPLDSVLLVLVLQNLHNDPRFTAFRFRSSTNAEDLEGFNGAGLYNSFTGRLNDEKETVEMAIKSVWASLWNYPAFEEREYYKIDQRSCAMGVLVHRSFPAEEANGVAITYNPYNINHGYLVNAQFGEESIVNPRPGIIHDQIILFAYSISGNEPFTPEYITHSNLYGEGFGHVLTDQELFNLGNYLNIIKEYFYFFVYDCGCGYKNFALDVEFKVESSIQSRKIYIKQVRPY